jgi:hypothetical protein
MLLIAVAGLAAAVFGAPRNIGFSFAAPTIIGRSDMASVVIRSGLVQLSTPVAMR